MKLPERFHTLSGLRRRRPLPGWRVTPAELVRHLLQPSPRRRGERHIASFEREGDHFRLRLKADAPDLLIPGDFDYDGLCLLVSEQLDRNGWHFYRLPETDPGADDVVIDCGACEGLFSALAHRSRAVYAVEPSRHLSAFLRRSFASHPHIQVVEALFTDREGEMGFLDAGMSSRPAEPGDYRVRATTLDAFCAAGGIRPTYLKVDVEGGEPALLRGAEETIASCRPRIAIAAYHEESHGREIVAALRRLHSGYRFKIKGLVGAGAPVLLHAYD